MPVCDAIEPTVEPIDAIDELVSRSKDTKELRGFHRLHRAHPEILDFLVVAAKLRLASGFTAFSYGSLYEYARWKLVVAPGKEGGPGAPNALVRLDDRYTAYYARAIAILHPGLNGWSEFRICDADAAFGLQLEAERHPGLYAPRLEWADGTPLDKGWRPKRPHVPHPGTATRYGIR